VLIDKSKIKADQMGDTYYRVADLLGLDDAIRLSEILAGQQIKFKLSYDLDNDYPQIVECIGKVKTKVLARAFSGENVYFSSLKKALKTQIHTEIRKQFTGYNYKELALKYGYTERNIRIIVSSQ